MKRTLKNAYVKIVSILLLAALITCIFSACDFSRKYFTDTSAIWSYEGEDFKISFTTTGDRRDNPLGTAYFNGTEYSIFVQIFQSNKRMRICVFTDNVSDNETKSEDETTPSDETAADDETAANDTQTNVKYKTLWGFSYKENKDSIDIEIIFDYTGATGENSPIGKKFTLTKQDLY